MSSIRVLTIDDNDAIRLSIASFLEDMGYEVFDAASGEAGLDILKNNSIDIILTDTHMPGLSGIDVLNHAKENYPDTPIVVISGAGEIKYVVEALRAGAWDYIIKPIEDLDFLTYTIERALKRVALINENRTRGLELEQKNIELKKNLELLQSTQRQLVESEKMASLGYMVSGVAHEINTPLGVCMTSISYLMEQSEITMKQLLSDSMTPAEFKNYASNSRDLSEIVYNSLQTINNLIINFKQLSMKSSDTDKIVINLKESIESVIMFVTSSYPNITVDIDIDCPDIKIGTFPEAIHRVFMKLTENSMIHGFYDRDHGKIKVEVRSDSGMIHIKYVNDGHPMAEEVVERVFDPFFTVNKKRGSGLGLSIVHNIVNFTLMGKITCFSLDSGIEFNISFPADVI